MIIHQARAGYAREGGKFNAKGGNKFELVQQYFETKNGPGAAVTEAAEDPSSRTFEVHSSLVNVPRSLACSRAGTRRSDA